MIQEVYVLDRENLSIATAFIEPEDEWFYFLDGGTNRKKCYNEINPDTKVRTDSFYYADDVFSTKGEGLEGLRTYIKNEIECNLLKIGALQQKNEVLNNLLKEIEL